MADFGFSSLTLLDGTPNPDGLYEQCTGVIGVYSGKRDVTLEHLALCGGGTVLVFLYNPGGSLPSLVVIQQGMNYYIWIAGTVNVKQWIGNVVGSMDRTPLGGGVYVHSYFWSLAQQLWTLGQPYLPDQAPGLTFCVVGHSLGGAVAQIIGWLLLKTYSAGQVKVITLGQPKVYSEGADSFNGFAYFSRFRILFDPIPQLPLDAGADVLGGTGLNDSLRLGSRELAALRQGVAGVTNRGDNQRSRDCGDPGRSFWVSPGDGCQQASDPGVHAISGSGLRPVKHGHTTRHRDK